MKHVEGNFKGVRNINHYYQAWLPEADIKAVIIIVHGLGEHSGRYMNLVNHFVPLGYAIYGFDLLGHGRSDGQREVLERFADYGDTLTIYYNMVKEWQVNQPIFLLGHSMGGLIVPEYLLEHQAWFKGAIISAPVIKAGDDVTPMTIILSKILARLAPKMGVQTVNASSLSHDPGVVDAYVNDPFVFHKKTPARLAAELLKNMQYVSTQLGKITLPFIAIQAGEDRLVHPDSAQMFFDLTGSQDKTVKIYTGFYHEVLNEPERARVLKDIEDWLEAHR
jgi:acylglycerol lipase